LLLCHRSDAIYFHQRIAGKIRNGNGRSCWPSAREISFENFVHAIEVFDFCKVHGDLEDAVPIVPPPASTRIFTFSITFLV